MEHNCEWHFEKTGRGNVGKDPTSASFNQPYYSIVRESLQNSLDAAAEDNTPVKVVFSRIEISRKEFPNFFLLENHLRRCEEYVAYDKKTKAWVSKIHPQSGFPQMPS